MNVSSDRSGSRTICLLTRLSLMQMPLNQSDFCASTAEWTGIVSESEICSSKSESAGRLGGLVSPVATLEEAEWYFL